MQNTDTSKMTQEQAVLKYLHDFGAISALDAIKDLGVLRLGARIYDLRRKGHNIGGRTRSGKNRYGNTVSWTEYYIIKEV